LKSENFVNTFILSSSHFLSCFVMYFFIPEKLLEIHFMDEGL
jgi:hypothetical protein